MTWPPDTAGRRAARANLREQAIARAEREAADAGRSHNCRSGWHHNPDKRLGGCRNDGTGCLCDCHDQETTTP